MILVIGAFFLSMVPAAALFIWLYNQKGMQEEYKGTCKRALISGLFSPVLVLVSAGSFHALGLLLHSGDWSLVPRVAYHDFFVLAMAEEIVKFLVMRWIVKKGSYSWLEVTIVMVLVGLGFEVTEAVGYAVGTGPMDMLMRGATLLHCSYGFVMGYFYGKTLSGGSKAYAVVGFVLAWLTHGLYDFMISEEIAAVNDNLGFISLLLAFLSIVVMIRFVFFVRKAKRIDKYTEIIV